MESMRLCREVEGMTSLPMLKVLERQLGAERHK
jgi:hypothetical protein